VLDPAAALSLAAWPPERLRDALLAADRATHHDANLHRLFVELEGGQLAFAIGDEG
jgi:hypothetical protein